MLFTISTAVFFNGNQRTSTPFLTAVESSLTLIGSGRGSFTNLAQGRDFPDRREPLTRNLAILRHALGYCLLACQVQYHLRLQVALQKRRVYGGTTLATFASRHVFTGPSGIRL